MNDAYTRLQFASKMSTRGGRERVFGGWWSYFFEDVEERRWIYWLYAFSLKSHQRMIIVSLPPIICHLDDKIEELSEAQINLCLYKVTTCVCECGSRFITEKYFANFLIASLRRLFFLGSDEKITRKLFSF
jgi:hypothetical protein